MYPGKAESGTFVLDFFNEPDEILESFQPYYQTAELADVTDPDKVFELFNKLKSNGIFLWSEVEQFATAFFSRNKSNAVLANICKPAIERWQQRYNTAITAYRKTKDMLERCKQSGDAVLVGNAEKDFAEAKKAKDELEIFKKDLGTFTRFYEFMSQIVDYDDKELEKLSLFARNLRPMLRENIILDDEIDLSNVEMSHYRLSKLRQIDIELQANSNEHQLEPSNDVGSATAKDKKEDFLSSIIHRLNEVFVTDKLTDQDMINYANTIADKVYENNGVMSQIANNTREQAMLGDFPRAIDDAILGSHEAHREQMMQLLSDPSKAHVFGHLIFDMLANRGQTPLR
jgi:type I restriction enzyme R subunit